MIQVEKFGDYNRYILSRGELTGEFTQLGATALSLRYRGRQLLLHYDSPQEYIDGSSYLCASIGRYANRIAGAKFKLDGREYKLNANEGENQLHGGAQGFDKRRWEAELRGDVLRFSLESPDGDMGFPGRLSAWIDYSMDENTLRMDFYAKCDKDTVYSPTSHLYFNLDGSDSCLEHELEVNAHSYLELDREHIPTGRILPAQGRYDFHKIRRIAGSYDDCFILNSQKAALLSAGGLSLSIETDFPAIQVYTGDGLKKPNQGLALEPQFYPDSPNHSHFPSTHLKPGVLFHKYISLTCFQG